MKELHVIIHEGTVRIQAERGNKPAERVLNELKAIKASAAFVRIPDNEIPENLSPDMPAPGDLKVLVSGAFLDDCCSYQLFNLKEAGYDASFHPTACLKGEASPPKILLRKTQTKYPDFYEGYY